MELIDRYVHEVGRHLPRSLREDVEQELLSNLEEALDRRMAGEEPESQDEAAVAVLKDLGPPRQLATSYLPKAQYLVGPDIYPAFTVTVKLCLGLLIGLLALTTGMDLVTSGGDLIQVGKKFLAMADSFFELGVFFFGIIVIAFAVIERTAGRDRSEAAEFDPLSLPELHDPDRIQPVGQVVKIVLVLLALVALNFFRDRIGSFVTIGDESGWVPMLGDGSEAQLPLLNLALILELVLNGVVLARGRWQTLTRWLEVGVDFVFLAVLFRLGFGPDVVAIDPQWMTDHGWSQSAAEWYQEFARDFLAPGVAWGLRLLFVGVLFAICVNLYRLFKRIVSAVS